MNNFDCHTPSSSLNKVLYTLPLFVAYSVGLLHGDMDQSERNRVITEFKRRAIPILVATDVAGESRAACLRTISESILKRILASIYENLNQE